MHLYVYILIFICTYIHIYIYKAKRRFEPLTATRRRRARPGATQGCWKRPYHSPTHLSQSSESVPHFVGFRRSPVNTKDLKKAI